MYKRQALLFAALLLVVLIALYIAYGTNFASRFSPEEVRALLNGMSTFEAALLYGALYIVGTILFLPGTPLTILAGTFFGPLYGFLLVVLSATIGATLAFLLSRALGKNFFEQLLHKYAERIYRYNDALESRGFLVVLFLRLVPLFPFNGLNFALGLSKVRLSHYLLGTLIGIAPASFAFVYFGNALTMLSFLHIALGVLFILAVMLLSVMVRKLFPMEQFDYDIIVVGAGAGGLNIAGFMNRIGLRVLLIEKDEANIGGDCLNTGCVPSKALIHIARSIHTAKKSAERFGVSMEGAPDMEQVRAYIEEKQAHIRERESAEYFRSKGMEVVIGEAALSGAREVAVSGKTYRAKNIILATGTRPRVLSVPGAELPHVHTNESIFSLTTLPKNLVVVGSGPIGSELGQAFRHLGSSVSVVSVGEGVLGHDDSEASAVLLERMKQEGIAFYFKSKVLEITERSVVIEQDGEQKEIPADTVLLAVGRERSFDSLSLESASIALDEQNMPKIDDYLRTSNPNIYVVGDAAGGPQFTHTAEMHAQVLLRNIFLPRVFWKKLSLDNLSWITYTTPEVATFGLSEHTLKKRGIRYERIVYEHQSEDRAIIDEAHYGKTIVFVTKNGTVLGGSVVHPEAGVLLRELSLAQAHTITLTELFQTLYPYPGVSRANRALAQQFASRSLTKKARALLRFLYA